MPELPEVELTMRVLKPRIVGKRISGFSTDWLRGLKSTLKLPVIEKEIRGRKIMRLRRHGKVLFMDVGTKRSFALHLRMSGSLLWVPLEISRPEVAAATPKEGGFLTGWGRDKKHVHFVWRFNSGEELWFSDPRKFGVVWYGTAEEMKADKYIRTLGPDAVSISLAEFRGRIKKHRGMLKPLLLRQDVIAGLGNIIVDEMLWEAKFHPRFPAEHLSENDLTRLYACMKKVIERIIAAEGNTVRDWIMPDGREGSSALRLKVYERKGQPCPRCGAPISRMVVGGRGTHFCNKCQRL